MRTDTRFIAWTPATDTHELPAVLRGHPPTVELRLLDPRPPVEAPKRPRTSGPLRHLWASARAAFWPATAISGYLLGRYLHAVTRDWTPDQWLVAACLTAIAFFGVVVLLLRNPRSFLSRLVDGPADDTTTGRPLR